LRLAGHGRDAANPARRSRYSADIEVVGENVERVLRNARRMFTLFYAELEAIYRPFSGVT
jgi:hypothetical protein